MCGSITVNESLENSFQLKLEFYFHTLVWKSQINMLFKIIATHNYETCTAHNEETKQNFVKTMMTAVFNITNQ